jgi:hypothetical protein
MATSRIVANVEQVLREGTQRLEDIPRDADPEDQARTAVKVTLLEDADGAPVEMDPGPA